MHEIIISIIIGINNPSLFTEALTILKDVILHTVKESKNHKQEVATKSQSRSRARNDKKTVSSPFSASTSPQSQISSGFVSLKDDDLLLDYCPENRQRPSEDVNTRLSIQSSSDERDNTVSTPQVRSSISPKIQTKRSQPQSTPVHSQSIAPLDPETDKKIKKRKLLLSPEKDHRMEWHDHVSKVNGDNVGGSGSPIRLVLFINVVMLLINLCCSGKVCSANIDTRL